MKIFLQTLGMTVVLFFYGYLLSTVGHAHSAHQHNEEHEHDHGRH